MASRVGQQLGNYRLIRLLGRGGFAEVYLGEQVYLNTYAALKVLHVRLTDEQARDFLQEAQTIAPLEHAHIVQVLDYGVQEGTPFLVMRYAPYGNLRTAHPKGSILPAETIVAYVKQVAAALAYAHERNLIHRDIKPENMLLGAHQHVLLGDFGLAMKAQRSQLQPVIGTMPYMAPEQLRGNPCTASDQYALGVVVYEWLSGTPPFIGSSLEVAIQHVTAPVPRLCAKVSALPLAVERVVLRALAKDPAQRFVDITAFATALEQALLPEKADRREQPVPEQPSHTSPLPYLGRQHPRPLVGRVQEWERLHQLLLEIESGTQSPHADHSAAALTWSTPSRPSCMMLLGEAGIGKTRLAEEVSREAQRRGWAIVWSRGYAQERGIPYSLWIELLRNISQQRLWQPQKERFSPLLMQSLPVLSALVPELAELLPEQRGAAGAPGQEQQRLREGVLALLATISEHKPLLIVLDDLHWADESSCELLGYLIRRLAGQRIFLLGTYREHDLPATHNLRALVAPLQQEQLLSMLHVPALTEAEIGTLVAHIPAPLIPQIQRQAAGNPLFAEELARVSCAEGKTRGAAASPSKHVGSVLPQTIATVLDLRMGTLSSACRRFLSRAAVLGDSFVLNTIRLLEAGRSDVDKDTVLDLLEEALHAGILTEEGSGKCITYRFWHPLLVSHLYEGLSAARRASLHRHAAEVLRQVYQGCEEEGAAAIAYHLVNGGAESPQIAYFAELAGDRAYVLSAYPEAAQQYRLAVERSGTLPPDAGANACLRLANLLERLGECTKFQGYCKEARRYFEQALEVHRRHHPSSHLGPQYEAQIEALLWCEIGKTWFDTGDFEQAQQCYSRGEQALREAEVATGPGWASLSLEQSYILWRTGNFEEARQRAQHALNLFGDVLQRQDHTATSAFHSTATRRTLDGDPVDLGRTHTLLASIAATVGASTSALDHLHTALAIFERYDRQREIAMVCGNLGDVYLRKAEHTLAQAAVRRSLSIAEQIGETGIMAVAFGNLGMLSARFGELKEAEEYYKRGLTLAEQIHDPVYTSLFYSYLATVMQDQGKIDEARKSLCQGLRRGRATSMTLGVALIALGQFHIAQALASQEDTRSLAGMTRRQGNTTYTDFLQRARITLRRALALEGLEAETRTEGQLTLAQVSFLLGEFGTAQQQVMQAAEEIYRYEQTQLQASAQRLMGSILAAQGQHEQADLHFQKAMEVSQKCGMRLEHARTLQKYGLALLQRSTPDEMSYQQGLSCLREARAHFIESHAVLDLQVVERLLLAYCETSTQQKIPV